ncbi:hypothetical protein [Nostoc piscinale]
MKNIDMETNRKGRIDAIAASRRVGRKGKKEEKDIEILQMI